MIEILPIAHRFQQLYCYGSVHYECDQRCVTFVRRVGDDVWVRISVGDDRRFFSVMVGPDRPASHATQPESWAAPYADQSGPIGSQCERALHLAWKALAATVGMLARFHATGCDIHTLQIVQIPERKRARCGHGHATTDMILANYQEIVSPDEAERYWSILPAATAPNVLPPVLLFI